MNLLGLSGISEGCRGSAPVLSPRECSGSEGRPSVGARPPRPIGGGVSSPGRYSLCAELRSGGFCALVSFASPGLEPGRQPALCGANRKSRFIRCLFLELLLDAEPSHVPRAWWGPLSALPVGHAGRAASRSRPFDTGPAGQTGFAPWRRMGWRWGWGGMLQLCGRALGPQQRTLEQDLEEKIKCLNKQTKNVETQSTQAATSARLC